eukprot:602125-Pelagomonas_calceolata.AAC.1
MEAVQQDAAPSEYYATSPPEQAAMQEGLHTHYGFYQQPHNAERITDVLSGLRLLSFSFAVISLSLLASVMSDAGAITPKQRFLLA